MNSARLVFSIVRVNCTHIMECALKNELKKIYREWFEVKADADAEATAPVEYYIVRIESIVHSQLGP